MKLHFDKLYSIPRISEPCFVSIPFSEGSLTNPECISFVQDGKELPLQQKVTSYHKDGSIRHLFVRFEADLPANQGCDVQIIQALSPKEPQFPKNVCTVVSKEQGFFLNNGVLSFTVKNKSSHLFSSLDTKLDSYQETSFQGPFFTDDHNRTYEPCFVHWKVVESGNLCVILSCDGYMRSGEISHPCEFRVTAYAGKPWLDLGVRLINAGKEPLVLSDYVCKIVSNPEETAIRTCVASSNYKTKFSVSEEGESLQKEIDAEWLINEGNEHFAETYYGTFFADVTGAKSGVTGTVYQAYQNFPKAVEACTRYVDGKKQGQISLYLVPAGKSVTMQPGMAREQNVQLLFHATDMTLEEINHRSIVYQMPDRPILDAQTYEISGTMPDIFVIEKDWDAEEAMILCGDAHTRSYGMMNWGDAPDPNYTAQGRGKGRQIWTNNEYDFPHACMLMYARSGIRRFLDYALVAGKHQMDVDVCHYSDDPLLIGGQWEHTQGHCVEGVMVCSHQWVEGILDCYHATGDERFRDTAIGIGENVLRLLETPMYQKAGCMNARETGWALRTLTALYTETHEERWLSKSDWIVEQFKEWADTFGGFLAPYTDNTAIRVPFMISVAVGSLMRYYREIPREDVKELIIKAVDDMVENCLLDNGVFFYKELPSLSRQGNNALTLEALAIAYELTDDIKYLKAGIRTYRKVLDKMCCGYEGGKRIVEDAVLVGNTGTKQFAQTFLPFASFYHALEIANL